MNYRHGYHAGNFGDVVKHAVLALLLERLREKDKPFCVVDTHAGTGRYDLMAAQAAKTGEWRSGILRVLAAPDPPAELAPYLAVVRAMNPDGGVRWYPGSPRLAQHFLRAQDRMVLVELHPEERRRLAAAFADDPRVKVHPMDGYVALKAVLPPTPRRGLVLIDPPYEAEEEFARVVRGLGAAWRRWATGIYAIWYPIKQRAPVAAFHDALRNLSLAKLLVVELLLRQDDDPDRLNGCGLVIANAPWLAEEALRRLMPGLLRLLGEAGNGSTRIAALGAAAKPRRGSNARVPATG